MKPGLILLCAALLVDAPFGTGSAQSADHTALGCYAVTLGHWAPALGGNERYHAVPAHIRLDTAGLLSPNIAYPYPRGFRPRWALHGDTLTLSWSNGFAPTTVTVQSRDSLLVGNAIARSDAIPLGPPHWPQASVTLRREVCGSRQPAARKPSNKR